MKENMGIPLNPELIIHNKSNQLREDEMNELELQRDKVSIFANFEIQNLL